MDEQNQPTIPPKATPMAAPGAPRPITVRLKPIASPLTPVTTSGMPDSSADPTAAGVTTVRLRPVAPPPNLTAQILPSASPSSTPAQITATVQAAKSKTSRIALDSAIGVATSIPIASADNSGPKTIRLKRPTDLATPTTTPQVPSIPQNFKSITAAILPPMAPRPPSATAPIKPGTPGVRQTSRIPDSVIPTETPVAPAPAPVAVDSSMITQKKTLKIRRPGAPEPVAVQTESAAGTTDGVAMTPISEIESMPAPKGGKAFSVVAIIFASAAAVLLIALNWCLAADAVAPLADKNAAASVPIDVEIYWPGKFPQ